MVSVHIVRCLRRLRDDESGATMIEFGLMATMLFLLIMGIVEFGLLLFTQMALEGAVGNVGRTTSIGNTAGYPDRVSYVQAELRRYASELFYGENMIISTEVVNPGARRSYVEPELCLTSPPTLGPTCPNGTPYEDSNGNGVYDGGTLGNNVGASGEMVQINVALPWEFLTPLVGEFFPNGAYVIRSATVVKNEPF